MVKTLGFYVMKNKDKIKKYMFPGKNAEQISMPNLMIGMRSALKKRA